MLQLNKNIKLIRELSGKKQEDFARLIKTNISNLKTYENTTVRPKAIVLAAIADYAGITMEDLENKVLTHKDIVFKTQDVNLHVVREPEKSYQRKRQELKNGDTDKTLTYYEVGAAAGHAAEILPVNKSEGVLHISDLFKGSQFAIRISGNSMTPNYPSGAIIGIREIPDKQITPGSVYVIEKDSDLWIKRLYYKNEDQAAGIFQCVSDNTMTQETGARAGKLYYPMFEIEMDKVRRLFKVTGIYKANELTVIN